MDRKDLKHLLLPMSFKTSSEGVFTGYANVFNVVDSYSDRIVPGAFTDDLQKRGPRRALQWQHQDLEVIGVVELAEDSHGLRVTSGRLAMNIQRARDVYELMKLNGVIGGMSIGYWIDEFQYDGDGVRELQKVRVGEVSLVTNPANGASVVDQPVKDDGSSLRQMHRTLRQMTSDCKAIRQRNMSPAEIALDNWSTACNNLNRAILEELK